MVRPSKFSMAPLSVLLPLFQFLAPVASQQVIETDVLILGGGMTGVSAAHSLYHTHGIEDFLIVEARHELGGRVQDHQLGNYSVEFGANWIQGLGDNPIWKLAEKYGVKNRYSDWKKIDYFTERGWDGEDGPLGRAVDRYEEEVYPQVVADAGRRKELGMSDLSLRAGLRMNGWTASTPEEWTAEYFLHDWESGEPPVQSSYIKSVESYNSTFVESGNATNNIVIDQAGYKQVILRHAAEIPNINQKVHLNEVITSVSYTNSSVTATTKSGLTIRAKKAICTFSLGVLQHSDVTFSPQLPSSKLEAIANFHMATYTKIFARFKPEDKFWNETEFWLYADPDERGYYPVWQPLDIPGFLPGSGIVFATLTGQQAIRAEHQSDEEVKREFLAVLRRLYGEDKVPEPVEFTFPRWTRDPLFRGTFTNCGAGVTTEQQEALKAPVGGDHDRERTLWFAGEHTSRKHFGYLHGAFREGRSSAGEVADCLLRGCQQSEETLIAKRDAEEFMDLSHLGKRKRMYVPDYA